MAIPLGIDSDALGDLVTWAIRDAVRRDVGQTDMPDPYATMAGLGLGNPIDVRMVLASADQELRSPDKFDRPANISSSPFMIAFAMIHDAFIANCTNRRADQIAADLIGQGYITAVNN